jgi:hypothetical protein
LEYEEQMERTSLPKEYFVKQTEMSIVLQLVQDMSNQMISFERKGITTNSIPVESSSQVVLRNQPINSLPYNQPKAILSRAWCNFCDDNHEESTCEVKKKAQERIFGKINEAIVIALDFMPEEDVMVVNTQSKFYIDKGKGGNPKTTSAPSSSSLQVQILRLTG